MDHLGELIEVIYVDGPLDRIVPWPYETAYGSVASLLDESGQDQGRIVQVHVALDPPLLFEDVHFGGGQSVPGKPFESVMNRE